MGLFISHLFISVQHPQLPPTHYNLESGNYFRDAGTEYQWSDSNLVHYYNFFLKPLTL